MIGIINAIAVSVLLQVDAQPGWLNATVDDGKSASLQLASRRYVSSEPRHPELWLIGVTHVGDQDFYDQVEALMADSDLVLYESVMEEATRAPAGETPEARRASTRASLEWLAGAAQATSATMEGVQLESMDDFQLNVVKVDRRLVDVVRSLRADAWGHPIVLSRNGNATHLVSLGSDGKSGGEAEAADIEILVEPPPEMRPPKGIQEALAESLGLEFQLAVLPYERIDWKVSDMTWERLQSRFKEEGMNLEAISGMLEGSSLPAGIVKLFLRLLPALDVVTGGAVTDGVKVMLVELLGREDAVEIAMREVGGKGGEILIDERNAVVIEDLMVLVESSDHDRISILYGAGHMKDLAERLEAKGWMAEEARWLPAITVDLENSKLSSSHMAMIRTSINMAMKRMEMQAAEE